MKKRLLSILLAVTLMASALVGCGEKKEEEKNSGVENVQDEETSGTNDGVMTEGPDVEDGMIEVEGEVTVIEDDDDSKADTDWSTAYDDYFTREDTIPQNVKMTMSTAMEGISMNIVVAVVGETSYMRYDLGSAALDLYATGEKIYARTEMAGEESWMYAPVASEDEVDSVMSMTTDTTLVDPENVSACTYVEEVVEDGVTYDVLSLQVDDGSTAGEAIYYVNRETQKVEKFEMEQDGSVVEGTIEEIDSIELPAEAANAVEGTSEDIAGALMTVMFAAFSAGAE